jgi:hypothetical protein
MSRPSGGNNIVLNSQNDCGCPTGFTLIEGGICQKIETINPTTPSSPVTVGAIVNNQDYYVKYGAIVYEDITLKQWPIIASPQATIGSTNSIIPASGPNPNPFIVGGASYTSLNPGSDGINYTGGIIGGRHAKIIKALPPGWPGIAPIPPTTPLTGRALRESTITSGVLNYGIGNPVTPQFQLMGSPWRTNSTNWLGSRGIQPYNAGPPATPCDCGGCYNCEEWYGFTHCVTINSTKTYYVVVSSNNSYRFFMNGNLVVEFNVGDGDEPTLNTVSIFPITLPAGTHVFGVDMLNYTGDGGYGFDIYDCTLAQLQGLTTTGELDLYSVFSAYSRIGTFFDVSTAPNDGYSCPEGYIYSNCNGEPQCIKITTEESTPVNYKLTPCCDIDPTTYIVGFNEDFPQLPIIPGTTVCIKDIDEKIGCWLIETTCDEINYEDPITVDGVYVNCELCYSECQSCINFYFILKDCCFNEPISDNNGPILYNYTGASNDGITPESIGHKTLTRIEGKLGQLIEGCFYLEEVNSTDFPDSTKEEWIDVFYEADTVPTCLDCIDCRTCYLLTNCENPEETIVTNSDLSQYVNYVVHIEGCEDKCWKIEVSQNCNDCKGVVTIITDNICPPKETPGKVCSYQASQNDIRDLLFFTIVINGTTYTIPYDGGDVPEILADLNNLGLGDWTLGIFSPTDARFFVTGSNTYGQLCATFSNDPQPIVDCVNAVCESVSVKYDYENFIRGVGSGRYCITIDSVEYCQSSAQVLRSVEQMLLYFNSLGLGTFTANYTGAPTYETYLTVIGDHEYGDLRIIQEGSFFYSNVATPIISYVPDCDCCLPKPAPAPPLVLKTRAVLPGYKTPGCSPEYTEKVNCAFGQLMNKQMLSVRYGLQTCCDDTETDWEIKKELLDFESIKDQYLTE